MIVHPVPGRLLKRVVCSFLNMACVYTIKARKLVHPPQRDMQTGCKRIICCF